MNETDISWATMTWNFVTGCSPVSPACDHCYAARMAKRLAGRWGYPPAPRQFDVTVHWPKLYEPTQIAKPQRIFVVSMGDLFHEQVPDHVIFRAFEVMRQTPRHRFMVLTKRPKRMRDFLLNYTGLELKGQPLPHVAVGITAENQEWFDRRWRYVVETPAAVRYISAGPLLGPLDVGQAAYKPDLVVVEGESGPGARPMHPVWVTDIRDQCLLWDIPFHFKQWGAWWPLHGTGEPTGDEPADPRTFRWVTLDGTVQTSGCAPDALVVKTRKEHVTPLLDGVLWRQMPEALRLEGERHD